MCRESYIDERGNILTSNLSEKQIEAVNAIDNNVEIIACGWNG